MISLFYLELVYWLACPIVLAWHVLFFQEKKSLFELHVSKACCVETNFNTDFHRSLDRIEAICLSFIKQMHAQNRSYLFGQFYNLHWYLDTVGLKLRPFRARLFKQH